MGGTGWVKSMVSKGDKSVKREGECDEIWIMVANRTCE